MNLTYIQFHNCVHPFVLTHQSQSLKAQVLKQGSSYKKIAIVYFY